VIAILNWFKKRKKINHLCTCSDLPTITKIDEIRNYQLEANRRITHMEKEVARTAELNGEGKWFLILLKEGK
jgi:hypothetical protein